MKRYILGAAIWFAGVIITLAAQTIRESRMGIASNGHEYLIFFGAVYVGSVVMATDWDKLRRRIRQALRKQNRYAGAKVVYSGGRAFLKEDRRYAR
jgi:hypothetical protein